MDICLIGGRKFNVHVESIKETFNILYAEGTGRSVGIGAPMVLNPLGTFIGHQVVVACKSGYEDEYDELFNYLLRPRYDGIMVKMVHDQGSIEYEAYVSTGEREVRRIDTVNNKVYWKPMSINIVPIEAQVLPA